MFAHRHGVNPAAEADFTPPTWRHCVIHTQPVLAETWACLTAGDRAGVVIRPLSKVPDRGMQKGGAAGCEFPQLFLFIPVSVCSVGQVRLFVTPGTVACQAPLSMGLPWLPFPLPGDLPHPGITLMSPASPALAGGFFKLSHQGNPSLFLV